MSNTTNAKTTLTVTLPDGTTATRKTHRTYTHVVAFLTTAETTISRAESVIEVFTEYRNDSHPGWSEEEIDAKIARAQDDIANAVDTWWVGNWCGRLDLAEKIATAQGGFVFPVDAN
jgi:hypothetical protein